MIMVLRSQSFQTLIIAFTKKPAEPKGSLYRLSFWQLPRTHMFRRLQTLRGRQGLCTKGCPSITWSLPLHDCIHPPAVVTGRRGNHVPRRDDHCVSRSLRYGWLHYIVWLWESSGGLTDCPLPDCLPDFYKAEAHLASSGLECTWIPLACLIACQSFVKLRRIWHPLV